MFRIPLALLLAGSWLTALQPVNAQSRLPRGSYEQTCRDSYVSGNTLYSICKDFRGNDYRYTQVVNFQECRGDIYNVDGYVTCARGTADAPRGTYLQTCRDIEVRGNFLFATCKTATPQWRNTSLQDFAGRRGDIANINGVLTFR